MAFQSSFLSVADRLAFTPLYVNFHAPGLNISSRIGLKLKPSGSDHVFEAVEKLFLAFMASLQEDLACFEKDEVLQEFIGVKERAIRSLEEWQEFVDDWKSTLIRRMTELHSEVSVANRRVLAAEASEKEVNQMLKEKDTMINDLLRAKQMHENSRAMGMTNRPNSTSELQSEHGSTPLEPISPGFPGRLACFTPVLPSGKDATPGRPRRFSFSNAVQTVTASIRMRRPSDAAAVFGAARPSDAAAVWGAAALQDSSTMTGGVSSKALSKSLSSDSLQSMEEAVDLDSVRKEHGPSQTREELLQMPLSVKDASDESSIGSSETDVESIAELQSIPASLLKPPSVDAATQVEPVARCNRGVQCILQNQGERLPKIGLTTVTEYSEVKRRGAGSQVILPRTWKRCSFA